MWRTSQEVLVFDKINLRERIRIHMNTGDMFQLDDCLKLQVPRVTYQNGRSLPPFQEWSGILNRLVIVHTLASKEICFFV